MSSRSTSARLLKLLILSLQILLLVSSAQWAPTWGIRVALAEPGSEAVPSQINMFWAGNQLRDSDLENVLAWGKKAKGTQYSVTLWTTKETLKKLEESGQLKELKAQGVVINENTSAELTPPQMQEHFVRALNTGSYALASDIARYSILLKKGGMYVDTDFGPGNIDLSRPLPQLDKDSTPLFAPMLRTKANWEEAKASVSEPKTNEKILDQLYKEGINNGLIVAPKESSFLHDLNAVVLEKLDKREAELRENEAKLKAAQSKEGNAGSFEPLPRKVSTNDAAWISGPMVVKAVIKRKLEERNRAEAEEKQRAKSRWRRFWEKITRKKQPAPIPVTDAHVGDEASVLKHGGDFGQNLSTIDWVTDASDPDRDKPDSDKPDSDKPDSDKAGTSKSGSDKPGPDRPGTSKSGSDKPDSDKPASDKPGSIKSGSDKAGSDKAGSDKPGSDKPGSSKSDSNKSPPDETCG